MTAAAIIVTPGPSMVTAAAKDDRPTRWCFACRAHLSHSWELLDDPPERQPSYYEPVPVCRCSGCGGDHTAFPGQYVDGPHYPSVAVWAALIAASHKARPEPDER